MTEPLRVAGIVLAAGASRRMGRNKMLLELEGESVIRRVVRRAIAARLSPVVVVLGHEPDAARAALAGLPCETTLNPEYTGPTSGSLHRGLRQLPSSVEAAVVMLADMVLVTAAMLEDLARAAAADATVPLVVSRYGDVTAPPLLFRRSLFGELLAWTGEGCGKAVVQRHRHEARLLDWPDILLTDIDTPDDLEAARVAVRQGISTQKSETRM